MLATEAQALTLGWHREPNSISLSHDARRIAGVGNRQW